MKIKKVIMMLALNLCMLATPICTYADETQTITAGTGTTMVTAVKTSSCAVMIPKTITLSEQAGKKYTGSYSTKLSQADLDVGTKVKVSSPSSCSIANTKNSEKTVIINNDMDKSTAQADTYVYFTNTATTINGELESATDLTAGTYSGTIVFTVTIETNGGV